MSKELEEKIFKNEGIAPLLEKYSQQLKSVEIIMINYVASLDARLRHNSKFTKLINKRLFDGLDDEEEQEFYKLIEDSKDEEFLLTACQCDEERYHTLDMFNEIVEIINNIYEIDACYRINALSETMFKVLMTNNVNFNLFD